MIHVCNNILKFLDFLGLRSVIPVPPGGDRGVIWTPNNGNLKLLLNSQKNYRGTNREKKSLKGLLILAQRETLGKANIPQRKP